MADASQTEEEKEALRRDIADREAALDERVQANAALAEELAAFQAQLTVRETRCCCCC